MKKNTLKTLTILLAVLFIFTSCEGWNVQTTPITQSEAVIAAVVDNFIQDAYTVGDSVTNISSADIPYTYTYTDGTASTSGTIAAGDTFTLSARGYITLTYGGYEVSVCVTDPDNVAADTYFAGGLGIEKFPYLISSEEEFNLVGDLSDNMIKSADYYYFKVTNDLDYKDMTESPLIAYFRGVLDFDGHTLSGLSNDKLVDYANTTDEELYIAVNGSAPISLIGTFAGGAIKNLDIIVDDYLALVNYAKANGGNNIDRVFGGEYENKVVYETTANMYFTNITYEGTIESAVGNNYGNFLYWAGDTVAANGTTLSDTVVHFEDCVSAVDIQSPTYFAAFLGGYAYNSAEVYFTNCENKGTLIGSDVAALIGNKSALQSDRGSVKYYITNCSNTGSIIGMEYADLICSDKTKGGSATIATDSGNVSGDVRILSTSDVSATADSSTNIFSITNSNSAYEYFEIRGIVYGTMYYSSDNSKYGTQMITFGTGIMDASAVASCSIKKLKINDVNVNSGQSISNSSTDAYGNTIITVDATEYYAYDGSAVSPRRYTQIPNGTANLTWYLYCYDSDMNLVGYLSNI